MVHNEPWQVYAENGQPIEGGLASREEFGANPDLVMGASHVWIWRQSEHEIEVLLQKRAESKNTWPGYLDISAAGHIDAGENPVQSAVREAREEIGIELEPNNLYYIFALRTPLDPQELDTVFIYELNHLAEFSFDDGEVEELKWVLLSEFEKMVKIPDEYKLVPQGNEYFSLVISALRRISNENH